MLTNIEPGKKVWKSSVVEQGDEFVFAPAEVEILGKDRGMIEYKNENGGTWLWYGSQFFHSRLEALIDCHLLNLEAEGVITERKKEQRAEYNHLKDGNIWKIG